MVITAMLNKWKHVNKGQRPAPQISVSGKKPFRLTNQDLVLYQYQTLSGQSSIKHVAGFDTVLW